jgi:diguanylate cyclase
MLLRIEDLHVARCYPLGTQYLTISCRELFVHFGAQPQPKNTAFPSFGAKNVHTPKVLVVNDDPATLLALESLLRIVAAGEFDVVCAHSGEEALREVLTHDFAVILLDVKMPGMDGFETAEAIHTHPRSSTIPIIFTTAYFGDEINRLKGYENGAVDYLVTPVIPQILQTKVSVFVEMAKNRLELQNKTEALEALNNDMRVQQVQELKRVNSALETEVTERRQAEQLAHELATRDALTRLPNRRSLFERLEQSIAHAARHNERLGLLFLDLDKFKAINDTLGHEIGDGLLIQVAARIASCVRESDMVARLGGDEFVVLLDRIKEAADATLVAQKIVQAIAHPCLIGNHEVRTSASIGIGLYPLDGESAQSLIKSADIAMYEAKKQRRGSIQFFHDDMNVRMAEREQFGHELQHALEAGEFELLYQPKAEISSNRVVGVEALLRWRHARLGYLGTERFLPEAAEHQLLLSIDKWVICAACEQARRWLNSGEVALNIPIAVNIHQIGPELPKLLQEALKKSRIPATCLQLEIAEDIVIEDLDKAGAILREIADSGIVIAIDEFGTGYSSLSVLKKLPIRMLKIDRSFVRGLDATGDGATIVAAIVNMARALGLPVIADGVEGVQQFDMLKDLGCDQYQGSLSCEVVTADALELHLKNTATATGDSPLTSSDENKPHGIKDGGA